MFRTKLVFIFILLLALVLLSGCDIFTAHKKEEIDLHLSGLPYNYPSYYLEIYAIINGSDPTNLKTISNVNTEQTSQEKLKVDTASTELVIYAFAKQGEQKPVYFATIPYEQEVKSYTAMYWLDYAKYAEGIKEFGISGQLAQPVEGGIVGDLDFSLAPYYLYQIEGASDQSFTLRLNVTQGSVNYSYNSSLAPGTGESYTGQKTIALHNYPDENLYILFTPGSYEEPAKGKLSIETHQQIPVAGVITALVADDSSDRIYATARVTAQGSEMYRLYYINPLTKSIEKEVTLPAALNPGALAYSPLANRLYILGSGLSGTLGIWDPSAESLTTYQYAVNTAGRDLGIDPLNRYIYIAATTGFYIVDLDNPATVIKTFPLNFANFQLDLRNQRLFATDGSYLYRYALNGNLITEQQKVSIPIVYGSKLLMEPGMRKVYYLNATSKSIVSLDAANLLNMSGTWKLENTPDELAMSPDGSILYAIDGGTVSQGMTAYLYVFHEYNPGYGIIRKFPYRNTANTALLALNSDGSVLAGYSREYNPATKMYDSYICFYENIGQVSALSASRQAFQMPVLQKNYNLF